MRILHVIWHLGQGGAQTYLLNLLMEMQKLPNITCAVAVLSNRGPLSRDLDKLNLPVTYLGMRSGWDLLGSRCLYKYFRGKAPDIIHSHSNNLLFNAFLQSRNLSIVYTDHGGGLLAGRKRDKLIYRIFETPIRRFIAISEEMRRVMVAANPRIAGRIIVVHNGVKLESIDSMTPHDGAGIPDEMLQANFRVGIIGRLAHQKGIDIFLQTASEIARSRADVVFPIVGDGPLRKELEKRAATLGLAGRTFFLGYRTDAIRLLKLFDVFLFTSNYEPFGLVLLEAMAARVPVVGLHLRGAVPEIVQDSVNGFVVNNADATALASCVLRLLTDAKLREGIVRQARRHVEKQFTIERNAKKVVEVYQQCLGTDTPRIR